MTDRNVTGIHPTDLPGVQYLTPDRFEDLKSHNVGDLVATFCPDCSDEYDAGPGCPECNFAGITIAVVVPCPECSGDLEVESVIYPASNATHPDASLESCSHCGDGSLDNPPVGLDLAIVQWTDPSFPNPDKLGFAIDCAEYAIGDR